MEMGPVIESHDQDGQHTSRVGEAATTVFGTYGFLRLWRGLEEVLENEKRHHI
jgi:hypothetical protein